MVSQRVLISHHEQALRASIERLFDRHHRNETSAHFIVTNRETNWKFLGCAIDHVLFGVAISGCECSLLNACVMVFQRL